MNKILIEIKDGIATPVGIPVGTEVVIQNFDTNKTMIEKKVYKQEDGKIFISFFGTGSDFTKEEIEEAMESSTL